MQIQITPRLYKKIEKASQNRWSNSKKGRFGRGLINSKEDPYRAERLGLLGEAALAQLIDRKVDYEYKEGGVPFDFRLNNLKLDIKTAHRNYGSGLIRAITSKGTRVELKSDVYVFGYVVCECKYNKIATIELVGYLEKEEIEKCNIVPAKIGKHKNYDIPYDQLKPIETLKKIRKTETICTGNDSSQKSS